MVRRIGDARKDPVLGGRWWRCDSYELIDGLIAPSANSGIEQYDPWSEYLASKGGEGTKESPYDRLVSLLRDLKVKPGVGGKRYTLTDGEDEAALLNWCSRHGLLGVLPTRTQMISLHPRWERGDGADRGTSADLLYPVQRGWVLTGMGWAPQRRRLRWRTESADRRSNADAPEAGDLVPLDVMSPDWPRPGVLIRPLDQPTWAMESFSESWAQYFRVPTNARTEEFAWPSPVSKEFCQSYSEPLDDFLSAASMLVHALSDLAAAKARPENTPEEDDRVRTGLARLNLLTSTVHPILLPERNDSAYQQRWLAPTLLSSYAMMVLLDLADPSRRPVRCSVCTDVFHTSSPTAEYCSETCRDTAYKRRRRAEERKRRERAKRQHSKGRRK